jgi:hypothetical protein
VVEMFLMVRTIRKGPAQIHPAPAVVRKRPGVTGALPQPAE